MSAPQLSLCVGVTGHRDIAPGAVDAVRKLVGQALDELEKEFGLSLVLFSSLAEGADRLVAEVALARPRPARLVVPLPSPTAEYETDFETAESLAQFRELLGKAENMFVVDQPSAEEADTSGDAQRVRGYRAAGLFVARSCQVLLALSDGKKTGKPAGTWEVVLAKQAGESPIGTPDAAHVRIKEARGVVVEIRTPRLDAPNGVVPALVWPAKDGRAWKSLVKSCRFTARLNSDARKHAPDPATLTADRTRSAGKMKLRPDEVPPGTDRLIDLYAIADHLAVFNQTRVRRSWLILYAFGVSAVFAYGLYAHTKSHHWSVLAIYLVALLAGFIAFVYFEHRAWHDRFVDYRGLAEGLRVAFFWRVAGLPGDPVDRYPANLTGEVEWVRMALRGETARSEPALPLAARTPATIAFALEHWVDAQASYFKQAGQSNSRKARRAKIFAEATVALGVLLAASLLVVQLIDSHALHAERERLFYGALIAIAVVPFLGAAVAGYADRRGYEAQARQYQRMTDLFEQAQMVLASLQNDDKKRNALALLAGEALAEHAQWVVLHRERPFEFVGGA